MELHDRHVVVTGAASGIGRGLARRFAEERPRALVLADRDADALQVVADAIGGHAIPADIGSAAGVKRLIDTAEDKFGPIEVFFSNAGIPGPRGGPEAPDEQWQRMWDINVMSHIWAARTLLPGMVKRGEGYLLSTASAAGLLTEITSASYSVTKHAAVALAEWISINYGDAGIRVSCLCPQGVNTPMLDHVKGADKALEALFADGTLEPADVAEVVVEAMRDERFLILPHEEVGGFLATKGAQPERWLRGMRKLLRNVRAAAAESG